MPRISVLMTIYNGQPFLALAIESIISQDHQDWELIAVENGSTDNSLSILKGYKDDRIKIHRFEKNIGRTPALRYANDRAAGEFIAILDADDIASSDRFRLQLEFLDCQPNISLVGSWAHYINENGEVIGSFEPPVESNEVSNCFCWGNPIAHSSAMYRAKVANEYGGYPENFHWGQDMALFINFAKNNKVAILGEHLCQIRILKNNMTRSPENKLMVAIEKLELLKIANQKISHSKEINRLNLGAQVIRKFQIGIANFHFKNYLKGIAMILSSLVQHPIEALKFLIFKFRSGRMTKLTRN